MAYATLSNIQDEFKNVSFSASTHPTDTIVTRFISEVESVINGKIGRKYQVPVSATATESQNILRMISISIVVGRVKELLKVTTGDKSTTQDATKNSMVMSPKAAWEMVDDIVKGKVLLSDAKLVGSRDGLDSFVVDNGEVQIFQRDTDSW